MLTRSPRTATVLARTPCALLELRRKRRVGQKVDLLFRKIDRRLDVHAQLQQLPGQRVDGNGELAGQRAQRCPRRLRRTAIDQVGDGFGLRQVELVIEEGPLCELAGFGAARAEFDGGIDECSDYDRPAVPLQLEHRFASKRCGCREIERQPDVDRRTRFIAKRLVSCRPRFREAAEHRAGNALGLGARHPHDTDAPLARRRGSRDDRVFGLCHIAIKPQV